MPTPPDWFERLTGFREGPYEETRQRLDVRDGVLTSRMNGARHGVGTLEVVSLAELRRRVAAGGSARRGSLRVSLVRGEAGAMHRDPVNRGALFQVASQFNLLEMIGPQITPEHGVTRYQTDRTQGPACAIAAGAATIYRNYFLPVEGEPGQTATRQQDCLDELGRALGNAGGRLWTMSNGYALATRDGLEQIASALATLDGAGRDDLRGLVRIGLHHDVEVTSADEPRPVVSQALCSALPVAYSESPPSSWEPFARLVLEAAYEATLCAAAASAGGVSPVLYLTQLGGGAFGNDPSWILDAMGRALSRFRDCALDARIVSYGSPSPELSALVAGFG